MSGNSIFNVSLKMSMRDNAQKSIFVLRLLGWRSFHLGIFTERLSTATYLCSSREFLVRFDDSPCLGGSGRARAELIRRDGCAGEAGAPEGTPGVSLPLPYRTDFVVVCFLIFSPRSHRNTLNDFLAIFLFMNFFFSSIQGTFDFSFVDSIHSIWFANISRNSVSFQESHRRVDLKFQNKNVRSRYEAPRWKKRRDYPKTFRVNKSGSFVNLPRQKSSQNWNVPSTAFRSVWSPH